MAVDRNVVEAELARINAERRRDQPIALESLEGARFVLSFPNRAMPEGQCIDQDFSEIQWALHERANVFTNIVGGRLDEARDRYVIEYETVEWD